MQVSKADIPSYFLIGSLVVTLVTGWNELQDVKKMKEELDFVRAQTLSCKHRVTSLEQGEARFNDTLKTINSTLIELNGAVRELKGIVESNRK